jgi:hypothetical protein
MTEQSSSLSQRAEARAAAKARRAKRIERREAFLDLVASGYSHRQIATAMKVSLATVQREVDKALAERPLHAPERHASLQIVRLSRALCHADFKLANGDIRAFAPYMKLVAALDAIMASTGVWTCPAPHKPERARRAAPSSPSPTASSPSSSRRSRRNLHNLAPKTLKSLPRLSTLQVRPGEMETRLSPSLTPSPPSRRKLHNSAPKTLKSLARLPTLHGRSDQMEIRLSLSPTPSPLFRRSRRKLHDLAPKTLKSQARLSTLHARSDEPEARRRRIIAGRQAARRSRRTQCARRSSRLIPLPLTLGVAMTMALGAPAWRCGGTPRAMREALISSPAPPPSARRESRCS